MPQPQFETIIIGTGFGGLCMGYDLKKAGQSNFVILEKAKGLGGTWRENTYPGAECDTPSCIYSYSFDFNPDWDHRFSEQPQILKYMQDFAAKNNLHSHIKFETKVSGATFDETGKFWTVKTDQGDLTARFVVSAVGQLHYPKMPGISGVGTFKGPAFHSAQWDHSIDLKDKKIGVVGSAASAVQFIPEIAKIAKTVTVYQRSPNWIRLKGDKAYGPLSKWISRAFPIFRKMERSLILWLADKLLFAAIQGAPRRSTFLERDCLNSMKKFIDDEELREVLTPKFPIGAKRILFSDNYYEALARDNVDVISDNIGKVMPDGIKTKDGEDIDHDVIIYSTGFHTNPFLMGLDVQGRGGRKLSEHWANGAFAYNSVATSGFPNLFFMYGPNSNTGHGSIILKLENQSGLISQLILKAKAGAVEVKREAEAEFDREMQDRLSTLAWTKVEDSWYKDGDKVTNNWPGTLVEYSQRLSQPNWAHFNIEPAG